jgi:transcriptional antiterminator NusG
MVVNMPEDVHHRETEPLPEDVLPDEEEATPTRPEPQTAGELGAEAEDAVQAEAPEQGPGPEVVEETPAGEAVSETEATEETPPEDRDEAPPETEPQAEPAPTAEEEASAAGEEEELAEAAEEEEEEAGEEEEPAEAAEEEEEPAPSNKHWYVVKVQSGREESIREAIERRVKIEGLEEYFGQIHIPTERVTEVRNGQRVEKERKLYPGYIMAEVEYNDRILYLFRETSGVGDFVGGTTTRPPPPMSEIEVQRMMGKPKEGPKEVGAKPKVDVGDRVRITEGAFKDMEGEVKQILEAVSKVSVGVTIFGREVPVELEYWQVEQV